jgi:hypothetical protein
MTIDPHAPLCLYFEAVHNTVNLALLRLPASDLLDLAQYLRNVAALLEATAPLRTRPRS